MATPPVPVYLEVGSCRTFAGALQWPGWCRSAREEGAALQALLDYAPRYAAALGPLAREFTPPASTAGLRVAERLPGDATTDFGAPGAVPAADQAPLAGEELERLLALLQACWAAFDAAAEAAAGVQLRKGPRGGGREVDPMVQHVLGADRGYLSSLWAPVSVPADADPWAAMARVRATALEALRARARGETPPSRRPRRLWTPRYFIRRSAWHALDHAWEIQDRATPAS